MRDQKQTNNSFWYNNRFVLILLFVALYVVMPTVLMLWGWRNNFKCTINWVIFLYLITAVIVPIIGIYKVYIDECKRKDNEREQQKLEIGTKCFANFVQKINADDFFNSIKSAFLDNGNIKPEIRTLLNTWLSGALINPIRNAFINKNGQLTQDFKSILIEIIKKDLPDSKNDIKAIAVGVSELNTNIQGKSNTSNYNEQAPDNEKENKKYRFAEQVVGEICKNNKPDATDICAIRCLIDDILYNTKSQEKCCIKMSKDGNKVTFNVIDISDFKEKTIVFDNSTKTFNVKEGTFVLCGGLILKIKNGKVECMKKPI